MAKAKFHKSQWVFVKPVGTWAYVEGVVMNGLGAARNPLRLLMTAGWAASSLRRTLRRNPWRC